jgi:hypothetical protein
VEIEDFLDGDDDDGSRPLRRKITPEQHQAFILERQNRARRVPDRVTVSFDIGAVDEPISGTRTVADLRAMADDQGMVRLREPVYRLTTSAPVTELDYADPTDIVRPIFHFHYDALEPPPSRGRSSS